MNNAVFQKNMDSKRKHCFIACIKTNDIYQYIADDVEIRFDGSYYELCRLLPKEKNEKSNRISDELRWIKSKSHNKFVGLRAKSYGYLIDDDVSENKKSTRHKKGAIKGKLKSKSYKNYLEASQLDHKKYKINVVSP